MNQRGEISIFTISVAFILLIVGMIFANAMTPIISGMFFTSGYYPEGSIGRVLLELIPLAPVIGLFYILFRQG